LALSGEEKKLLQQLTTPVGNTAVATPMVAKRLRTKLKGVLSGIDLATVRGKGYKLVIICD
jgi:DNA-binding response OmpR family regulator